MTPCAQPAVDHPHHLHPKAAARLDLPDEERIRHILKDCWVGYPGAAAILAELEDLYRHPRVARMPGLLIVGGSAHGKSAILDRFLAAHPPVDDPRQEAIEMPVLKVQSAVGPDERRFYNKILEKLGAPFRHNDRPDAKEKQVRLLMEQVRVRVLVLDEIHNSLVGPTNRQRHLMVVLKTICNEMGVCVVGAGTPEAQNVINLDPQLENRLRPMYIPRWEEGADYLNWLGSFEHIIPLRKASQLCEEPLASEILALSEGILGEAVTIVKKCAVAAVRNGEERIAMKTVRSLGYVPVSRRRELRPDGSSGKPVRVA